MYRLLFTHAYDYSGSDDNVSVPVVLRSGGKQVRFAAHVDTGASVCMFESQIAEELGLELTSGIGKRFRTANCGLDAFGHEVDVSVLGIAISATVYFFADPMIKTNVLGRTGWLDRIRFGLVHHDSKVYLAEYDNGRV